MSEDNRSESSYKNRYYPRMNVEVLLSYRPASAPAEEAVVTRTKTLGLGGLMFESDNVLEDGALFRLELVFGEEKVSVMARVVYSLPGAEGGHEIGFAFEDLSDAQREELTNFFILEHEKLPPDSL